MALSKFVALTLISFVLQHVSATIDDKRANQLANKVDDTTLLKPAASLEKWETVADQVKAKGGCDPNLCFALDGSASIPKDDYELQVNFVQLIAAIVGADPKAAFAAAQYGRELEIIRKLTTNAVNFVLEVSQSTFLRAPATFIEPGLVFCLKELDKVKGEPAKLVLLGDGRSPVFDQNFAAETAKMFRDANPANAMCAVGVGYTDPAVLEKIVGRADRVLEVTEWPKVLNILDELVAEICGKLPPVDKLTPTPTPTPSPKASACPCTCVKAASFSPRDERKAFRTVRKSCRKLKKCKVSRCPGVFPAAFKCC